MSSTDSEMDDRIQLTVVGSSPAVPNPNGACSSYLLEAGSDHLLVDCGHGAVGILRSLFDLGRLTAIIISHMHPDHIFDLVPLRYAFSFGGLPPIPLLLPSGGYAVLERLQTAAGVSDSFFKETFDLGEYDPAQRQDLGDLSISFAPMRHFVPGYAMRFASSLSSDRSLVYSADTGWSDQVLDLARGAKLALIESTLLEYASEHEATGHLTAELAGRLAREAGVKRLLLTHYPHSFGDTMVTAARSVFAGPVELAVERGRYLV